MDISDADLLRRLADVAEEGWAEADDAGAGAGDDPAETAALIAEARARADRFDEAGGRDESEEEG